MLSLLHVSRKTETCQRWGSNWDLRNVLTGEKTWSRCSHQVAAAHLQQPSLCSTLFVLTRHLRVCWSTKAGASGMMQGCGCMGLGIHLKLGLVLLCREQITHAAWNASFYPNMCTSEVKKISGMCGSTCWQKDIDFAEVEVNGRKIKGQRAQTWIIFFSCMSVTKASTTYSFLLHKDFTLILNISQ